MSISPKQLQIAASPDLTDWLAAQKLGLAFSNTPAEPLNSLGLRYETQLVGWMITHRVATDAIRYSTMFVDKRFQRLGRGISLLSQSILRQVDSTVPYCLFAVAQENPAMLKFVDKHLEPYLMEVTNSYVAFKQLGG